MKRLLANEAGVLRGKDAEAVHQARVAVRRLRSDLRSFKRFLDTRWSEPLRQELAWLGTELGAMRDVDVLLERLRDDAGKLSADGEVAVVRVLDSVGDQRLEAMTRTKAALRSARYRQIRDKLQTAARSPRFTQAARQRACDALPGVVRRKWKRVRSEVRDLPAHPSAKRLHRVRILAKRLRYATEAASAVGGQHAHDLAKAAAALQDALGALNDAESACRSLRRLRRKPELALGANALLAVESDAARQCRSSWYACWRPLDDQSLRAWL